MDGRGQAAGAVGPIDPIPALAGGPTNPALHGAESDVALVGDLTQRGTAAGRLDDLPTALLGLGFLALVVSWCRASDSLAAGG
jgi:hypothetical protein